MRALKLLPLARRRCLMAPPAIRQDRLPDAASFYEPPRAPAENEVTDNKVTPIGLKFGSKE